MKKYLRIPAVVLFLLGLASLVWYCVYSFASDIMLTPAGRLAALGITCVSVYFGSILFAKTVNEALARRIMKSAFCFFFLLYIMLLVTLVLFDSSFGRTGFANIQQWSNDTYSLYLQNSFNVIPFRTIWAYIYGVFTSGTSVGSAITNLLGNLVAFAPFAFFLPLLFKKMNRFLTFVVTMVCIVAAVEAAQILLLTGFCDIDDLILNVGGACILYGLLRIKVVRKVISGLTKVEY